VTNSARFGQSSDERERVPEEDEEAGEGSRHRRRGERLGGGPREMFILPWVTYPRSISNPPTTRYAEYDDGAGGGILEAELAHFVRCVEGVVAPMIDPSGENFTSVFYDIKDYFYHVYTS
jgi:hypothetical protein